MAGKITKLSKSVASHRIGQGLVSFLSDELYGFVIRRDLTALALSKSLCVSRPLPLFVASGIFSLLFPFTLDLHSKLSP